MASKCSTLQTIYELCKKTLTPISNHPPSSQFALKLCSLLDTVCPNDVGLKEDNADDDRGYGLSALNRFSRVARWAQPITYLDIHECETFTMCIFSFPSSAVIPLHDHPGMTVFSKILYGSLHVKSYDWVEPSKIMKSDGSDYTQENINRVEDGQVELLKDLHVALKVLVRLAKLAVDKVITPPCGTRVLYPKTGGNVHCFTAVTPCAVLDILTPPYDEVAGRKCTYYHDYPYSSFANDGDIDGNEEEYAWLAEIEAPNVYMRSAIYAGPPLQV